MRSFSWMLINAGWPGLAGWCPNWLKIPFWLMKILMANKKPELNKNKLKLE